MHIIFGTHRRKSIFFFFETLNSYILILSAFGQSQTTDVQSAHDPEKKKVDVVITSFAFKYLILSKYVLFLCS